MVLGTFRRKRSRQLLRLQHCKGLGQVQSCNVLFRRVVNNMKVFAGCRELFSKSCSCPSESLRRTQNLLAGCIFVGGADKSAFALLSQKVTKARRKRRNRKEVILSNGRLVQWSGKARSIITAVNSKRRM